MILTDTGQTYSQALIGAEGTDTWRTIYAVRDNMPGVAGTEFLITGKLGIKNFWHSAVECRIALFAVFDVTPPLIQEGLVGVIVCPPENSGAIVGENITPDILGKYLVLHETVMWAAPTSFQFVTFSLRISARSTAADGGSLTLGNGRLQSRRF